MLRELAILALLMTYASGNTADQEREREDYTYMATLSKYEALRGDIRKIDLREKYCVPINLWIFHRHGTRLPSSDEIKALKELLPLRDQVIENHREGRGSLSDEEINNLKNWDFDPNIEPMNMDLTWEGYNETLRTAKRFKAKFPRLLNKEYTGRDFYFRHSDKQRTAVTADAFIDGLFGEDAHKNIFPVILPTTDDELLAPFYGACEKLAAINKNYPFKYQTPNTFAKTDDYLEALHHISLRLGFNESLAAGNLTAIFGACAYELAWYQESNPIGAWCSILGSEGRKIGEYYWDLAYHDQSGYSEEATRRGGCGPVKDLWERFASRVGELDGDATNRPVVAYFSHDAHVMAIHSALGLLKDDPQLSASNYRLQGNRKWRTSESVPFAANIVAVLHECKKPLQKIEYEVTMLKNERPLYGIPGCNNGICSWESFRNFVQPVAEKCSFIEFC